MRVVAQTSWFLVLATFAYSLEKWYILASCTLRLWLVVSHSAIGLKLCISSMQGFTHLCCRSSVGAPRLRQATLMPAPTLSLRTRRSITIWVNMLCVRCRMSQTGWLPMPIPRSAASTILPHHYPRRKRLNCPLAARRRRNWSSVA